MTDYLYRCIDCGVEVVYKRAVKTGSNPRCKTHQKAYRNQQDWEKEKVRRVERKVTATQVSWSAGKTIKLPPRIDRLAEQYKRLEAWEKTANAPRGELLELQAVFAELKAPCHVERCRALYEGSVK